MVKIRKARSRDLKALVKLDKEAKKEISWWKPLNESDFRKFLRNKNSLYVAESERNIVGYLSIKMDQDFIKLEDMYVHKQFRNKKIAKNLIKKFFVDYKKSKINLIQITCPERLRKFYEKFGFKVTSLVMKRKLK